MVLFENARVFTGEDALISCFSVEGRYFRHTGDSCNHIPHSAERVDLGGRFVCAGFNDSHMHLLSLGHSLSSAQLAPVSDSLSHMLEGLRVFAQAHPNEPFIFGRGWNQDDFTDTKRFPNRDDLDAVCADRPCLITRACGHAAVANSAALRLAGIESKAFDVDGGSIETDASGRPTGVLTENAISLVSSLAPRLDRTAIKHRLRLAMDFVNRMGVIV